MIKLPTFTLFKINLWCGTNALKKNFVDRSCTKYEQNPLESYIAGIKGKDCLFFSINDSFITCSNKKYRFMSMVYT